MALVRNCASLGQAIEYVVATIGMASLLFGLTYRWIDRNSSPLLSRGALNVAKTFSRYSFTISVLHHFAHLWPLWIYGVANGQEPTFYWGTSFAASAYQSQAA